MLFISLLGLIPFEIFNISTINIIALDLKYFSGHLPVNMGLWIPNLEEIYLGHNRLSGLIPSSISNVSKLTQIEMTSNSFTGFVPSTLVLEILLNQLNGILLASIANLSTSFHAFEAFGCQIKGELPIGIGILSGLTTLLLDSNELTGFILSTLERLENLAQLSLEHNDLK
ncbi:hypothetical protein LguiB_018001 [Lonicera macranthoides]